ncbi:MAG: IS30 family transposase, partial [Flavobacteriales bacterium]|nr:IS30 family transposase [Flavobacteriales bacterium]
RELRRNCDGRSGEYNADLAARKSAQRKRDKPKAVRFTAAMRAEVERQLAQEFSPEQIVGMAEREGRDMVSHERIYQHVWQDKKRGGTLHEHLRTRGKRYRKRGAAKDSRGIIVGRVDIEQRPAVVEQRKRFGDLEMDTIIGKGHQGAALSAGHHVPHRLPGHPVRLRQQLRVRLRGRYHRAQPLPGAGAAPRSHQLRGLRLQVPGRALHHRPVLRPPARAVLQLHALERSGLGGCAGVEHPGPHQGRADQGWLAVRVRVVLRGGRRAGQHGGALQRNPVADLGQRASVRPAGQQLGCGAGPARVERRPVRGRAVQLRRWGAGGERRALGRQPLVRPGGQLCHADPGWESERVHRVAR